MRFLRMNVTNVQLKKLTVQQNARLVSLNVRLNAKSKKNQSLKFVTYLLKKNKNGH